MKNCVSFRFAALALSIVSVVATADASCPESMALVKGAENAVADAERPTSLVEESGLAVTLPLEPLERGQLSTLKHDQVWTDLMKNKKEYTYFIADDDRVILSKDGVDFSKFQPAIVRDANPASKVEAFVPKEAGTLRYDTKTKKFVFDQKYDATLNDAEHAAAHEKLKASLPKGETLTEAASSVKRGMNKAEVISCAASATLNASWKNFLATTLGVDLLVQTATFASMGAFSTDSGRQTVESKLSWTVLMTGESKGLSLFLVNKFTGIVAPLAIKYPVAYVNKFLNEKWNHLFFRSAPGKKVDPEAAKRKAELSERSAQAGFEVSLLKTPEGYMVDYFLLKKLSGLTMKMCQINPKLTWVFTNQSVRIVERSITGVASAWWIQKRLAPLMEKEKEAEKKQDAKGGT